MMARVRQFLGACIYCPRPARTVLKRHPAKSLIALALLGACSASAFAASRVSVRLEGEIPAVCFTPNFGASILNIGDVSKPGSREYSFHLTCNAPFSYRMEAEHGALTNISRTATHEGLAGTVPYEISVHIPTDGVPINDRCPGDTLKAGGVECPFSTSRNATAIDAEARLTIAWNANPSQLSAGVYADRLTLSIGLAL